MNHLDTTETSQQIAGLNILKGKSVPLFKDILAKITSDLPRRDKIKTGVQLADLIDMTYRFDERTKGQVFDQVTPIEINEFIFCSDEFLFRVAETLSYKCLVFLKKMDIGYKGICSRLGPKS